MNKTFFIAWVVAFIAWMVGGFVIHGTLLADDYARVPGLFRPQPEMEPYFPLMLLARICASGAFVWIYSRGVEATAWVGQGLRYGLAVALLAIVPGYLIYYGVHPAPAELVLQQAVFDSLLMLVLGLVVAFIYGRQAKAVPGT
jgi:hypothetical protein